MTQHLIDRDEPRRHLSQLATDGRRHLALVTGRRRIGKTFLLTRMWADTPFFYFTAARTTGATNRRALVREYARHVGSSDLSAADYPTWRTVFRLLFGPGSIGPDVLVLDEFQYLADGPDGLAEVASELNAVWEQPGGRAVLLVLSGSALGIMSSLAAGGSPLYGRFTYQTTLRGFDHRYARELTGVASLREATEAFACFGGTPRYLAAYDAGLGFRQNVERLLLAPAGEVRLLLETALEQEEGLRDVGAYRAILDAVARGMTARNEIAQRAGLPNDAGLRRRLGTLVALDYLREARNFEARANAAVRYELADPAFRFYGRFVAPYRSLLHRVTPAEVYGEAVAPHLDTYVGHAFERVAHRALDLLAGTRGLPLLRERGRWSGADRERRSVEIDIVGRALDGAVVTGEVKWNRHPITLKVHVDHLSKLSALAASGLRWAREAMAPEASHVYVAAGGFADAYRELDNVITLDLDDVYVPT